MAGGAMAAAFVGFGSVGTAQAAPLDCPLICDLPGASLFGDSGAPQALAYTPGSVVAMFDPILDNPLTMVFTFGMIGNGADGNVLHPDGFNGGFLFGSGGDGYSPTVIDGAIVRAGNGGNAGFFGGNGGNGGNGGRDGLGAADGPGGSGGTGSGSDGSNNGSDGANG